MSSVNILLNISFSEAKMFDLFILGEILLCVQIMWSSSNTNDCGIKKSLSVSSKVTLENRHP